MLAPDKLAPLLYLIGAAILVIDLILVVFLRIDAKSGAKKMLDILKQAGADHRSGLPDQDGLEKRYARKSLVFGLVGFLFVLVGFFVETCAQPAPQPRETGFTSLLASGEPIERDQLDFDSDQVAPGAAQR